MRDLKWILTPLALLVSHPLWSQTKVIGPRDYPLQSCSSTPATGYLRQCADTTTGNLVCVNALGGTCSPSAAIATGSMALPTTAIPANSCSTTATTAAAPGALPSDTVAWSFVGDPTGVTGYGGGVSIKFKFWTTASTINLKLCNETAASITPGAISINWAIPGRNPQQGTGGPTIQHHTINTCTGGTTSCVVTGQVVGTTGNAAVVLTTFCWNAACSGTVTPACAMTITDGTNTYTVAANSTANVSTTQPWAVAAYVAGNATAGTYSITFGVTGTGCSINFATLYFLDISGVAASPVDTMAANSTYGNISAAMVLNSIGNPAYANELILVAGACWTMGSSIGSTGVFTLLDRTTTNNFYANFYLSAPPLGAGITFNGSCTISSQWTVNMLGLHN